MLPEPGENWSEGRKISWQELERKKESTATSKHWSMKEARKKNIFLSLSTLTLHSLASASHWLHVIESQRARETSDTAPRIWVETDIKQPSQ